MALVAFASAGLFVEASSSQSKVGLDVELRCIEYLKVVSCLCFEVV